MKKLCLPILLISILAACGSGSDGNDSNKNNEVNDTPKIDNGNEVKAFTKAFKDESADTNFAFIDLTQAKVKATDEKIIVSMTVLSLDGPFTVNNPNVADDSLEYKWAAVFDVSPSVELSLSHYKLSGENEYQVDNL